jgi:DNA repair protein RadD
MHPVATMPPALRPYQLDLVDRLRAARARGARIIVMQATTGAGKTSVACHMAALALRKFCHVLFIVHRRRLVEQISGRLRDFGIHHGILMRGEKHQRYPNVQVASRDTLLSRCLNNEWVSLPKADLIFVDEGHRAASDESEYRRILAQYPAATIVLMTATPVGPDGRGLGPWAQAIECAAPVTELIQGGHLVPVKCYAPDRKVTRGKVKRTGIAGDLVESWKQYARDMATVLFTGRVAHSRDAVEAFNAEGIPAAHVDADTPDEVRDRIYDGVEAGRIKVLSNVGIVGEGVDLPALGCCQLYLNLPGRVRFIQCAGRIMRPFAGKSEGVLIDHSGACLIHGFPDEDTEWTLEGNADEAFARKHADGETEKAQYCRKCELLYHGSVACPQCGRQPAKPPRSLFAPPPVDSSDELLTEVDRRQKSDVWSHDEKVKHWLRCLGVAGARNGTFGMASAIYKQKYSEWPGDDFPCIPARYEWKTKVLDKYPDFRRGGQS